MSGTRIVRFDRFDLNFSPRPWAFAETNRAAIDARFVAKQRAEPTLWNGRVLLACEQVISDGVCRGDFLETDFASFDAWRDWGRPASGVLDCFAASALRAKDGAFLLGVMGPHTASAGQIYFPCGTPDPDDIISGRVDLEYSARREFAEETGLDLADFQAEPGWLAVFLGAMAMHVKVFHAREPAEVLRERILAHLASQEQPELSGIRIVRGPADLDPAIPPFVTVFLRHMWR